MNEGGTDHTFTMDDGSIDEELAPGATVDVMIAEAGAFHCDDPPVDDRDGASAGVEPGG